MGLRCSLFGGKMRVVVILQVSIFSSRLRLKLLGSLVPTCCKEGLTTVVACAYITEAPVERAGKRNMLFDLPSGSSPYGGTYKV